MIPRKLEFLANWRVAALLVYVALAASRLTHASGPQDDELALDSAGLTLCSAAPLAMSPIPTRE